VKTARLLMTQLPAIVILMAALFFSLGSGAGAAASLPGTRHLWQDSCRQLSVDDREQSQHRRRRRRSLPAHRFVYLPSLAPA
jgi:hypothetical protein